MAKLTRTTISRRTVGNLSVEKDTVYWDRELPGFGVRAYATGSKVYVIQTRSKGKSTRVTIGRHGVITPEEARRRAALIISRIKSGQAAVAAAAPAPKGPTVAEMANRMVETFSAMFSMAETWGLLPQGANPCPRVVRYKARRKERFLTETEFERLGRTLTEMEDEGELLPRAAAALRLLMLTGCRCNEILRLRWEEVDLERNELRLRDTKTGPRTVPLSPAAARVLAARSRGSSDPWVIPGRFAGRPLRNVDTSWRKVRARAGLEDVRLHDLRHSFASRALALGESLPMIGKLLGHTRVQTTARYAHLAEDSVKESAARIAASIGEDIFCSGRGVQ